MLKRVFVILISIGLFSFPAVDVFSQERSISTSDAVGTLTILVDGFENDRGEARIGISNSLAGFRNDRQALRRAALPIQKGKAEWVLRDLPGGKYAVKVYHDENSNGRLDRNALGLPREAYGFSNNVRGNFGPPDYTAALFTFDQPENTICISIK